MRLVRVRVYVYTGTGMHACDSLALAVPCGAILSLICAVARADACLLGLVVSHRQLARSFTAAELSDLYSLSPDPPQPTAEQLDAPEARFAALAAGSDDKLLRRLLRSETGRWVTDIKAHDSLLQADDNLELSAEERAEAKAAFEQEMQSAAAARPVVMPHAAGAASTEVNGACVGGGTGDGGEQCRAGDGSVASTSAAAGASPGSAHALHGAAPCTARHEHGATPAQ